MIKLSPPVAIHSLIGFSAGFLGAFVLAAVPLLFALRQSNFALCDAVAEINFYRDDGQSLRLCLNGEFVKLIFMQQQLAAPQRFMVPRAARQILRNVGVDEPGAI